jgi:hypothetical protein
MTQAEPQGRSLIGQLRAQAAARAARLRARLAEAPAAPASPREWRLAAVLAALIAAGPLVTLGGAWLGLADLRVSNAKLAAAAAPRAAAAETAARERATLAAALRRPGVGATADAFARALPADATLIRLERNAAGYAVVEIATPDPDRLRTALRAEPALAALRDAGQRQGDGQMIVSLAESGR